MDIVAIIPTLRCRNMRSSLAFYVERLGFEPTEVGTDLDDPSFCVLSRAGERLFLSSHSGDGEYGQAIVVLVDDVEREWRALQHRGYRPPDRPESPVHQGPTRQTWGTREFYVDDPDGNTLRFVQE
jgi:catechol 2,3-dioxygenase-like lactoylglutathione lyase family enzyme